MRRLSGTYTGIVLKKYPYKNKIALLDKVLGRIDGILFVKKEVFAGALLRYSLDERGELYFIVVCELVDVPLLFDNHDLYFLHHVLELCYYSVRLGSIESAVFDSIIFLYTHFSASWSIKVQQLFILRLLVAVGLCSEHSLLRKPAIVHVCTIPIDKIFDGAIELDDVQQDIQDLVFCSLAEHPYSNQFKTVSFLYAK